MTAQKPLPVCTDDVLLAEALVELGMLARDRLNECITGWQKAAQEIALAAHLTKVLRLSPAQLTAAKQHRDVLLGRMDREAALFGDVAIALNLLSAEQLLECVRVHQQDPMLRIGEIGVDKGFLTPSQVKEILKRQHELRQQFDDQIGLFGQIALRLRLLSREQLAQCVAAQERDGQLLRLGEVCVELGFLQPAQVKLILKHQALLAGGGRLTPIVGHPRLPSPATEASAGRPAPVPGPPSPPRPAAKAVRPPPVPPQRGATELTLTQVWRHAERAPRVLLADDEPALLSILGSRFRASGFEVLTAKNGAEAIRICQDTPPDVAVVDVMMPELNGFQVCRRIREQPALSKLPIVLLTGKNTDADRYWGEAVGASLYLTKPADPAQVLARVLELLRR